MVRRLVSLAVCLWLWELRGVIWWTGISGLERSGSLREDRKGALTWRDKPFITMAEAKFIPDHSEKRCVCLSKTSHHSN